MTWRRRDGELIDVRLSLRMVEDEDGGPPVFEGIAEDVTERHRRDERLRRSGAHGVAGTHAGRRGA